MSKSLSNIKKQRDNLEAFFNNCINLLFIADKNGRIKKINREWSKCLGYSPSEVEENYCKEFVHPEDIEKTTNTIQVSGIKPVRNFKNRFRHKDGSYKLIEWQCFPFEGMVCNSGIEVIEPSKKNSLITVDDAQEINITDLFDIEKLQKIQDSFADVTGVASLITYPDGTPITRPSNFSSFCNLIRSTKKGKINCYKSDSFLGSQNLTKPVIQQCLSAGLCNAGASITIGGRHVANWLIGQVRNEDQNEEEILKYADVIGIDKEKLKKAYLNVPVMPNKQFEKIAHSLFILANEISDKAYQNIQQSRFIYEQEKAEQALKRSEEQIRSINKNIPGLVIQFYTDKDGKYGVSYVNDSVNYLGLDDKNLEEIFDCFVNGIDTEDRDKFFISLRKATENVSAWEWAGKYREPSGKERFFKGISQPRKVGERLLFDCILLDITENKKAEKELDFTKNLLSTSLSQTPLPMIIIGNDYVIRMVNNAAIEFLGLENKPGYIGSSLLEIKPSWKDFDENGNKINISEKALVLALQGKEIKNKIFYTEREDGTIRWGSASTSTIRDDSGEIIAAYEVVSDITEQRKAEKEFRELAVFHQTILDTVSVGLIYVKNRKIQWTNTAFCTLFGYKSSEISNKNTSIIYADKDNYIKIGIEAYKLIGTGGVFSTEIYGKRKNGDKFWFNLNGKAINPKNPEDGSIWMIEDINERKKAEFALKQSKESLTKAQKIAKIGSCEINLDTKKGEFSDEMYRLLNLNQKKRIPKLSEFLKAIHPDDRHYIINSLKPSEEHILKSSFTYRSNPALGPVRYFLSNSEIKIDTFNKTRTLAVTIQDISEIKMAENEIIKLNQELERKVEERTLKLNEAIKGLESFAYSVSHDLRAPVRHIDGFVNLLYSSIPNPGELTSNYYNKIKTAAQHMSSMIDNLLSFSKLGRKELNLRLVNLNEIIKEIIEDFKPDTTNRNIEWVISQNLPKIRCDRELIKLALVNLISNAIKYTSKKEKAIIEIGSRISANNTTEIFIKDNGVGFDMTYVNKLFGVFQRLHNDEYEGIGIGLANVKQIIDKHKGTIKAEGKINEGATFYLTFI